jgi:hypothetical protein
MVVRRILLIAALLVVGVYGIAEAGSSNNNAGNSNNTAPGAGNGQGNGSGESNPDANGTGANPTNPPTDGCQSVNVPRKGEGKAVDDPRCPGYNGNAENTFTINKTSIPNDGSVSNRQFTVAGGWCPPTAKVTIKWSLGGAGTTWTTTTGVNRKFNATLTMPTTAVPGAGQITADCNGYATRSIAVTVT